MSALHRLNPAVLELPEASKLSKRSKFLKRACVVFYYFSKVSDTKTVLRNFRDFRDSKKFLEIFDGVLRFSCWQVTFEGVFIQKSLVLTVCTAKILIKVSENFKNFSKSRGF